MNEQDEFESVAAERQRLWDTFEAIWESESGAPVPPQAWEFIVEALKDVRPQPSKSEKE